MVLLQLLGGLQAGAQAPAATLHTVFTTECGMYFNWQTLGLLYSHRKSGQPGPITRLLSCTPEDLANFQDLQGVTTHVAPSWTHHPRTGDIYRYPASLCSVFLQHSTLYQGPEAMIRSISPDYV